MPKNRIVKEILGFDPKAKIENYIGSSLAYAPINFALIKYWGKENEELMIPNTNSFSVSLGHNLGTTTQISISNEDRFILNGYGIEKNNKKYIRLFKYIDLFRPRGLKLKVVSHNGISTGSGLASSASGFAALIMALDKFFNWHLSKKKLSILARLGSGSSSRSVYQNGFVEKKKNGVYTYSEPFDHKWTNLHLGILEFSSKEKKIGSREGMRQTVENSLLYKNGWVKQIEEDLKEIKESIKNLDFEKFAHIVQRNSLAMHATAISAGVIYWSEKTLQAIKYILDLQKHGIPICFTQDAGENLKILSNDIIVMKKYFPKAKIIRLF